MAFLRVMQGVDAGKVIPLEAERVIFGRHPSCTVILEDGAVSRQHAQITHSHGSYFVEDLRSRNGTQVNERDIQKATPLKDGDLVRVCDHTFTFLDQGSSSNVLLEDTGIRKNNPDGGSIGATVQEMDIADDLRERSSIISKIDVRSSSGVRLHVKPESKLRAILEIGKFLSRALKPEVVLPGILEALFQIYPQADQASILLWDEEAEELRLKASRNRRKDDDSTSYSRTIINQAMKTGEAILSADASEDSRFATSESLPGLRIRSMMCVPLVTQTEERLGVIQITTFNIGARFTEDDLDLLVNVASQCTLAIENAHLHQAAIKQRDMERELEFAMQVQLGFLPSKRPELPDYEFANYYEAAQHVGGDYYDYVEIPDGRIAITVADVAGKGVPAALLMARLYSAARNQLLTKPTAAAAMTALNAEIATGGLGHRFITCVLVVLDPKKHEATLVSAGHLPPLCRTLDGTVTMIEGTEPGLPLGIIPDQVFYQDVFPLKPGDTWLLYTDGVTEAMREDRQIYGTERLKKFVAQGPLELDALIKGVVDDIATYVGDRPPSDDVCLVGLQRNPC